LADQAKVSRAQAAQGQFEWSDGASDHLAAYWPLFLKAEFLGPTWTVVLNESKTDALAPLARFRRSFPLILLLTFGTVLLLSIGQIRRSLLPLQRLQQGARRIATRAFDTRVEVTSRDEFADVAASFNTMAARLGMQFGVLTTLNEINGVLNHGESLVDILRRGAETLQQRLGFASVRIWVLTSEQEGLELQASAGTEAPTDGSKARVGVSQGGLGLIAQDGRPHIAGGSFEDPRVPDPDWARREGMVAFVGQPLVSGAKVVGVIAAFSRQPVDEIVLDGLASAAGEIARCIERARVAEALRESGEQVRQLQKMEAVGRLAGGIAHDFNNLLTVISGHTQLLLRKLSADAPLRQQVSIIDKTAGCAAALTTQLLAFSRKQVLVPSLLDLNDTVTGSAAILERLIGEDIALDCRPGADVGRIKADAGQLEQVIMNLMVNARDAMPEGGRITLETANVEVTEDQSFRRLGVEPGSYVMLSVSDTGIGMDADTQSRIFEPFFTTKEPGKGTGLGLAMVYGIVKQSHGGIVVESAPRQGTTFRIYLPRVQDAGPETVTSGGLVAGGTETILLVEDEAEVLSLVEEMLKLFGYDVLAAAKVDEAYLAAERHPGPIDLLLTDVVMPQVSGIALAQRLVTRRPQMKVLYMSGHTDHPAVRENAADLGTALIRKPFTPDALGRKIRDVLDSAAS
jgi:signal transduction histidine kinase